MYTATRDTVTSPDEWQRLNDSLSDATGDAQELDEATRVRVQRVDRAIQAYERANDRGHVVYSNVVFPSAINATNMAAFLRNQLPPGTEVHLDRYTAGAHALHELDPAEPERTAVMEIQTRRGMYLGRSTSLDDTSHLLPRGLRLSVVGTHQARYRRPDGTTGTRHVIQFRDTTPG